MSKQTVFKIMFDTRAVDLCGKRQSLFKMAVSYLHLPIRKTDRARSVFAATGDLQNISVNADVNVFGGNSGKFDLDEPAVRRFVNVRRRIPQVFPKASRFSKSR